VSGFEYKGLNKEKRMNLTKSQKLKANTSRPQVPALFKQVEFPGSVNLDWGGGKYDFGTEYLRELGIENVVFDPYNRSEEETDDAWFHALNEEVHSITCCNVLNVIKSKAQRTTLLKDMLTVVLAQIDMFGKAPTIFISVHEKNGDGIADKVQTNMKTADYLPEIRKVFPEADITLKNKTITIKP
jgi:hypothetical protein